MSTCELFVLLWALPLLIMSTAAGLWGAWKLFVFLRTISKLD